MICSGQGVSGQSAPRGNVSRGAGTERRHLQELTHLNPVDLAFESHDERAATGFSGVPPSRDLECSAPGRIGAFRLLCSLTCSHGEHVTAGRG